MKRPWQLLLWVILISGGLVTAAVLTIGPSVSDFAGQLIGLGSGAVGIIGAFTIEILRDEVKFRHEIRDMRRRAVAEFDALTSAAADGQPRRFCPPPS